MGAEVKLSSLNEKLKSNDGNDVKNSDLITELVNRKIKFVSVIESLSEVLTNQDVATRERGIDFLSWILGEIPPDLFNSQEISAVVNFYVDRLKDHHSIAPATIKGLLAIVKMNNIERESIKQFLVPLFQEMNCQTQRQSDRYNIFSIVSHIVENDLEIVAAMGSDFVFGIISLADGETDPSNLILLFKFLPLLLKNIDLGHLMEEMFDLLSCYFPIDFNPAKSNISITRQDLADGLMNCLSAREDFADHCLPLILEKLGSTLKTARIDSYRLLGACCSTYTIESVNKYSNEIWKVLQKDVLPAVDSQICEAALYALSQLVALFSSSESERQILKNFLDDILTSIRTLLNNVEDTLFNPAMNVLFAITSKSNTAADWVLGYLTFVFGDDAVKTETQRKIVLTSLKPFLPMIKESGLPRSAAEDESAFFNKLSRFYLDSTTPKDCEIQKLAYLGILELVNDFTDKYRIELLSVIAKCVETEENPSVRVESLKVLRLLGNIKPKEIQEFLIGHFRVEGSTPSELDAFMSAVSAVANIESITQLAVPQMLNVITNSPHWNVGLASLLNSCKIAEEDGNEFMIKLHKDYNVTETLVKWWIERRTSEVDASAEMLSEIIALIVRQQELHCQQSIVDEYIPVLMSGLSSTQENVFLVEAILGSVLPMIRLDNFPGLNTELVNLALRSNHEMIRTSSSRLLASIVNKAEGSMSQPIDHISGMILMALCDSSAMSERLNAASLLSWIVKGLLFANSHNLESMITKWFDLLERDDIGETVAEHFQTVLREECIYLNMKSHCNVKILYRQRFFTYFPRLINKFRSATISNKSNYLIALTRLIEGVPKHVAVTELGNVVLITAQALDSGRDEIVASSLGILEELLRDKESLLADYAMSLVPKFLNLSRRDGSMKIRIAALKCLHGYGFYPTISILPLKREVVRSLEPCLDDRKRLVRREAVRARSRWYLVGAPVIYGFLKPVEQRFIMHKDVAKIGGYTYENGTVYVGGWNQKGQKHGFGRLLQADGTIYEGCFLNGLCSGLGVMNFVDGALYEGEFMEGWFHGHGVFWRADGMRYEGEFRGGRVWGLGLVTFSDQSHGFPRYEGFFQDCRLMRREKCPEVVLRAQKIAFLARNQAEEE